MQPMTTIAGAHAAGTARHGHLSARVVAGALAIPALLYGVALVARLFAIALISFPMTEGSAYYVAVARNLVTGRGLEIDAMWSYATPPLVLPRPAFELWQPLASVIAAGPMAVLGATFDAAQIGFALFGALLAPLAWLVAQDASRRAGLPSRRATTIAIGAGLLVAVTGPLVLSSAIPDSTLPFTVLGVAACLLMPAAASGSRGALIGLGVVLAMAYLTRMEAVWLGLAFVAMVLAAGGWRAALPRIAAVTAVAAVCALPWWLRNALVFGTPLPGQVSDNVFLTRNEQIFSFLDRPTLDGFFSQGLPAIVGNVAAAAWHNTVSVLLIPAGAVALFGLITIAVAAFRRDSPLRPAARGALGALLLSGAITFGATTLLFPVATLWGTFEHAAGPLLVGLAVAGLLGADAFVAAVVRWRNWPRTNSWLAPLAIIALTLPLTGLALFGASRQAETERRAIAQVADALPAVLAALAVGDAGPLISDRPIWLSDATGRSAIALPDESPASILQLAAAFDAPAVVLLEARGRYPAALRELDAAACFTEMPVNTRDAPSATVFMIEPECIR